MRRIACAFAVVAVLVGSVFAYEQTTYDYYVNDGIIRDVLRTTAKKVYEIIVRRFLSIFYPPASYNKVTLTLDCKGEKLFSIF